MNNHRFVCAIAGLLSLIGFALAACSSSQVDAEGSKASGAALSFTHYHTNIVEDGHAARVDYWVRGEEVVRQYWQDGALLYDERCEGKRLSIREMLPAALEGKSAFNYKEVFDRDSPEACFDAATHEELRYLRQRGDLQKPEAVELSEGRSGLRWVGATGHEFVVDAATKLPVRLSYGSDESGGLASIAFSPFTIEQASERPLAPEADWAGFQETIDVEPSEAGQVLGLAQVPSTVAGLELRHSWSYRTQNLASPTFYLIWGDDTHNVQLVSTAATLPESLRGFSESRTEYDSQEGGRHVKVGTTGGGAALLERALSELKPEALADRRVRADQVASPLAE